VGAVHPGHGPGDVGHRDRQARWDGHRFSPAFVQHLVDLTNHVATSAEQHLAYPALHYFHTPQRAMSAPIAIAQLDDALLLLSEGVAAQERPAAAATEPLRNVIDRFLTTASSAATTSHDVAPPRPPQLGRLGSAGIPVVDGDRFRLAVERDGDRRTRLHRLVNGDGWSWPEG
jgi:hypothetical protein